MSSAIEQAATVFASRVVRVTLFEDRAEVTRAARVSAATGVRWVALDGVSPFVDERSVQAAAAPDGRARVLAARVVWRAFREAALGREEIEALVREMQAANLEQSAALEAETRAEQAHERAERLVRECVDAVSRVPRGAAEAGGLDAWEAALGELDRAAERAREEVSRAHETYVRAHDAFTRAVDRLREGRVEHPRYEAVIEVQLEGAQGAAAEGDAGAVDLEVKYRVPCALWRPEHLARLVQHGDDGDGTVELVTYATAWQRTGERWDEVEVRFSTARPARAATPPAVQDDVLASRRKTDQERQRVVVEAREQAIATAGLDRGARAVQEMPGVDDGGEPLVYAPRERVSLASDGRPFRVEVARTALRAEVARVLFPERAPVAHLRATATLAQGGPLLAGPVRVARGASVVGRARVDYVGRGEPFELGFGADDGVRVRRAVDDERDTVPVLGTQKLRRTVRVYLSNLSNERKRVRVTERVPVSEVEEVEVGVLDARGWTLDARDGFAHADADLAPHATQTLALVYEVRAAAKVRMPF